MSRLSRQRRNDTSGPDIAAESTLTSAQYISPTRGQGQLSREELEELLASPVQAVFDRLEIGSMLAKRWERHDIGVRTIGELVEVDPDDDMLRDQMEVQSMVHRARLLKFIERTKAETRGEGLWDKDPQGDVAGGPRKMQLSRSSTAASRALARANKQRAMELQRSKGMLPNEPRSKSSAGRRRARTPERKAGSFYGPAATQILGMQPYGMWPAGHPEGLPPQFQHSEAAMRASAMASDIREMHASAMNADMHVSAANAERHASALRTSAMAMNAATAEEEAMRARSNPSQLAADQAWLRDNMTGSAPRRPPGLKGLDAIEADLEALQSRGVAGEGQSPVDLRERDAVWIQESLSTSPGRADLRAELGLAGYSGGYHSLGPDYAYQMPPRNFAPMPNPPPAPMYTVPAPPVSAPPVSAPAPVVKESDPLGLMNEPLDEDFAAKFRQTRSVDTSYN